MSRWGFGTLALFLMALTSAPSYAQKVAYDWDKDVDFSPYRTYKWAEVTGGQASNQLTHKRIISAIDLQLQAKNLKLSTNDETDLYVSYQVMTDKNEQVITFNPDGKWQPGLNGDASKPPPGVKAKGVLIVNLYDRNMKKLIWRGTVMGAINSRQTVNSTISKGLSELFFRFPPSGK